MALLFDRKVKLVVYFATGKKYEITDLHMTFEILLRRDPKPNPAKIGVYNLSETTRNLFSEESLGLEFYAGYASTGPQQIFKGTISNALSNKNGPDWITTIYAADGHKEFDETYFNKSYSAGTPLITIFTDIADVFSLPINIDPTLFDVLSQSLLRGVTFEGKAEKAMNQLAKDYDLDWSVQFGIIEVTPKGSVLTSDPVATLLTFDTGLIGSPEIAYEKVKKNRKSEPELKKIVKANSLLIPQIKPNRLIQILSLYTSITFGALNETRVPTDNADGIYLVDTVSFVGDNFGGSFDCKIEGIAQ